MTASQKELIKKLLNGHFLRYQMRGKVEMYILFDAAINPLQKVRFRTVKNITKYMDPEIPIWKKNRHGDISLNLSNVRRLHGRNTIKKLYKERFELDCSGSIYKKKIHKRKNKAVDQNIATLF